MAIWVLEGADGTGKSTLAHEISEQTKGHMIHCSWKQQWMMKQYFLDVMRCARVLNHYQDVVIDRWAPSEYVYGEVFRGGSTIPLLDFLWEHEDELKDVKWIICTNENAVENHRQNAKDRDEMFDDISRIVIEFNSIVSMTPQLNWIKYDFNKNKLKDFVKELIK